MDQIAAEVRDTALTEALGERYLNYALSTITSRSLPDVRDGLKPVHRRLLYAMRQLKLDPDAGFKKCARVVGDVIGKFHPHGDVAVYDALVRLAQDFAVRYPLVDGQGNFGNIDGDGAAAMRYTEARLTEVATLLLQGIDEDAVDFRETYDGEESEPVVLPAAFPNLLANGAQGIAVGMATNIPPHNVRELCGALQYLIKFPRAGFDKLAEFIPGPDFPTGGVLIENRATVVEAYRTGRGSLRVRARWHKEDLKGGGYQIVITEIPYQVQKARLVEKIAELLGARKLHLLGDVRDESAEDLRLVLEPKSRNVDPDLLMEQLFRLTDLESRFSMNLNVLAADGTPGVMDLRAMLRAYLDNRNEVLIRRTQHRLGKIAKRLETLEGYLIAYLNLDEVIRIIREEDEVKATLMATFELTEMQAEAILNMRLRSLRKLEEMEIRKEHDSLIAEQEELETLLGDEKLRWKRINGELGELKKMFGEGTPLGRRRTEIGDAPTAVVIPLEAMVEREPVTVVCSQRGWVRAVKGHLEDSAELKFKEGDALRFALYAQTTDKLIVFASNGRFYTLGVERLPGGRGHGEPLRLMVDLPPEHDVVGLLIHDPARTLLVASSDGRGFRVKEADVVAQTRNGKQVLNVPNSAAQVCAPVDEGADAVAVVGTNRKLLIFPLEDLPEMNRGRGVKLQSYRQGKLSDAKTLTLDEGLAWSDKAGRSHRETDLRPWQGKRAQAGRLAPRGFPRSNKFSG